MLEQARVEPAAKVRRWPRRLVWAVGLYLLTGLVLGYFQATPWEIAFTREWFAHIGFTMVMWLPVAIYQLVYRPI